MPYGYHFRKKARPDDFGRGGDSTDARQAGRSDFQLGHPGWHDDRRALRLRQQDDRLARGGYCPRRVYGASAAEMGAALQAEAREHLRGERDDKLSQRYLAQQPDIQRGRQGRDLRRPRLAGVPAPVQRRPGGRGRARQPLNLGPAEAHPAEGFVNYDKPLRHKHYYD